MMIYFIGLERHHEEHEEHEGGKRRERREDWEKILRNKKHMY
jgi:hypothetical protein